MCRALTSVAVAFAALALVMSTGDTGLGAAQHASPGAAACTGLRAATFTAIATLTAIYDAGSAGQPAYCVVRGSAPQWPDRVRSDGSCSRSTRTAFSLSSSSERSAPDDVD